MRCRSLILTGLSHLGGGASADTHVQGTLPNYNWNRQSPLHDDYGWGSEDYNNKEFSPSAERRTRLSEENRNMNAIQFNTKVRERGRLADMGQMQLPGLEDDL